MTKLTKSKELPPKLLKGILDFSVDLVKVQIENKVIEETPEVIKNLRLYGFKKVYYNTIFVKDKL